MPLAMFITVPLVNLSCAEISLARTQLGKHEVWLERVGVVKRGLAAICNTAQLPFEPGSVRLPPRKASKLSKAEGGFLAQEISSTTSGALASAAVLHSTEVVMDVCRSISGLMAVL